MSVKTRFKCTGWLQNELSPAHVIIQEKLELFKEKVGTRKCHVLPGNVGTWLNFKILPPIGTKIKLFQNRVYQNK